MRGLVKGRPSDALTACSHCGTPYYVRHDKLATSRYCSQDCKAHSQLGRLTTERLLELSMPEPNSGCWLFLGALTEYGYGILRVEGKNWKAHRAAYVAFVGEVPDGLTLDHLCRNRACINPNHLEPVPSGVNVLRGVGLSAQNARKTACNNGHPFTQANTMVKAYKQRPRRHCRICTRVWRKRSYQNALARMQGVRP